MLSCSRKVMSRPVYPAGRDGTGRDRDGIFKNGRDFTYPGGDSGISGGGIGSRIVLVMMLMGVVVAM